MVDVIEVIKGENWVSERRQKRRILTEKREKRGKETKERAKRKIEERKERETIELFAPKKNFNVSKYQPNNRIHIFYYGWYGNPSVNPEYMHCEAANLDVFFFLDFGHFLVLLET